MAGGIFAVFNFRNTVTIINPVPPEAESIKFLLPSEPIIERPGPVAVQILKIEILDNSVGFLNVRDGASVNNKRIDRVNPGEQFNYTETKNDWYHILLSDNRDGWVAGLYVKEIEEIFTDEDGA